MDKVINFNIKKRRNKFKNFPEKYLLAENLIHDIKIEYLKFMSGKVDNLEKYSELFNQLEQYEYKFSKVYYNEFLDRLNMSINVIDSIYLQDEEERKEARFQISVDHDVKSFLDMRNGVENLEFRIEYEKDLREEIDGEEREIFDDTK